MSNLFVGPPKGPITVTLPSKGKPTERIRIEAATVPVIVASPYDSVSGKCTRLARLAPGRGASFHRLGSDWAVHHHRRRTAPGRRRIRCRIRHR